MAKKDKSRKAKKLMKKAKKMMKKAKKEMKKLKKKKKGSNTKVDRQDERWSQYPRQNGGLAKMDSGFDHAANFVSFACVA